MGNDDSGGITVSFFLMPTDVMKGIHDELEEVLGPLIAPSILYRSGFRSGQAVVKKLDISELDEDTIEVKLPNLWIQIGLGIFELKEITKEHIIVECSESNEAQALDRKTKPSCHLTRGYLAGILSDARGVTHACDETDCIAMGSDHCIFKLYKEKS